MYQGFVEEKEIPLETLSGNIYKKLIYRKELEMTKIKNVEAVGEYVVLKVNEEVIKDEKTDSGIILPAAAQLNAANKVNVGGGEQKPAFLTIHKIGPAVPENCGFKLGDEVAVNMYDVAKVGDETQLYLITKWQSVMGIVEAER